MPYKPEAVKQGDPPVHIYLENILLFTLEEKPGVTPSIILAVTRVHCVMALCLGEFRGQMTQSCIFFNKYVFIDF